MSRRFRLDPRLEADTLPVTDLELCTVRLMNDARYPWLILVPRRDGAVEWIDLSVPDAGTLDAEIRIVSQVLQGLTGADKLNVAALGNVVSQLHVHVIARFRTDDAWPRPVWGVHPARPWRAGAAAGFTRSVRILLEVCAIPAGSVSTYSAVARRAGVSNPRTVGAALRGLASGHAIPWHRVVNASGRSSLVGEHALTQRRRLHEEGVEMDARGRIDLARFGRASRQSS